MSNKIIHFAYKCLLLLGIFLGLCTSIKGAQPPSNFKIRAFYLDFRAQVMTVSAIKNFASDLSQKGINTLLIEYEATFPFQKHATLCNHLAFSRSEVKEIINHCTSLGIDVIPLQNCFGHSEYILRHDRYAHLREDTKEISQVCPLKIEEAKKIFREIFQEVAEMHPSPYFHIGADETYLLGSCTQCSKVEKSLLFVNYIKAMCEVVKELGKKPIIWADIILMYPEAVQELPKDLIYVDWNYGWGPDRFGKLDNLLKLGVKMWGATALRSAPDNIYLTQWMKHFENLVTFLPFARSHGYEGIIETSWSTSGTYGFHYDNGWEVISMQPIRQVYPMSGFQILVDAYCQAANSDKILNPHDFILSYAQQRYGFSNKEAQTFLRYFSFPQELVRKGKDTKGTDITEIIKNSKEVKNKFDKISPRQNINEFEHYRLMLDLRINYLRYKEIEFIFNSSTYDVTQAEKLLQRLYQIITEAEDLDNRFIDMNKNYLKSGQAKEINTLRTEKMKELYQALQRQTKTLN
ncbi:family 20 glycosylhydrolase [uncultured Bacteroides sp.]|jgi:hypothetical protein|uniref:family 20 glycosylhydrolase n=1 Tax=uncultured Bacteroides sp. TaxID=162156 RepID=UPI0026288B1E|nr:family 20 glycosylhydrolase [uncultured Bacteroides sp.]